MAGARIFLQPLLDDTVGGIQSAVDDVVSAVEPIPDKIDEQITALGAVVDAIGASASSVTIKDDDDYTVDCGIIAANTVSTTSKDTTPTNTVAFTKTFNCYVDGTFNLVIPPISSFLTVPSSSYTHNGEAKLLYNISKNGTTVYSGTLLDYTFAYVTLTDEPMSVTEQITTNNISCTSGDVFVLTITLSLKFYQNYISRTATYYIVDTTNNITVNYGLVNLINEPFVVEV